MPLKKEFDKL